GFFAAMADGADATRLTDGLGEHFKIVENDFKLHACCGHTHTAADLAIAASTELGASADQVASITVETYPEAVQVAGIERPRTPYEAKFSIAYSVAAAWVRRDLAPPAFSPEGLQDPAVRSLMERIHVEIADDLAARYPADWPARVTVTLRTGERWTRTADQPLGSYRNPASDEALQRKFDGLVAAAAVDPGWLRRVRAWLEGLKEPGHGPASVVAGAAA